MKCDVGPGGLTLDVAGVAAATACPVEESRRVLAEAAALSCGREVFCREGTRQVATILADLTAGKGSVADLALVDELCTLMADLAPCALTGQVAASVLALLREHGDEWERHARRGRCTSLTCAVSYTVHVDPGTCTGCEACRPVCPVEAIAGGPGLIHVIDTDACTRCNACVTVCPVGAITKAGPIKPKGPDVPVPVGSFEPTTSGAEGGMRRRRRRTP